jgi:hypothetical protein
MLMVVVVTMLAMMLATIRRERQLAVEVRGDQFWQAGLGQTRSHGDAVLGKKGQRSPANAASNDHLDTPLAQPPEEAWLMLRRRYDSVRSATWSAGPPIRANSRQPPKCCGGVRCSGGWQFS